MNKKLLLTLCILLVLVSGCDNGNLYISEFHEGDCIELTIPTKLGFGTKYFRVYRVFQGENKIIGYDLSKEMPVDMNKFEIIHPKNIKKIFECNKRHYCWQYDENKNLMNVSCIDYCTNIDLEEMGFNYRMKYECVRK